jgi:hypothetical protein
MEEVPEKRLQSGEQRLTNHEHEGVAVTDESLWHHLTADHRMLVSEALSVGALRGIHDRFHGESHASDN